MFKPKKSLGQNFLIDKNISKKIVNLSKIKDQEIIEVGPGKGFLTDEILKCEPKKLTIIEKDIKLYKILKEKYLGIEKIEIINFDATKYDYYNNKSNKIISNLPYNISVKLIINWLKNERKLQKMILMIQKEVAEKMKYGIKIKKNRLNLFVELTSKYKIEFNVSNNVFFPKPKINSSVISMTPKKNIKVDPNKFELFTREIFQYKRKKLSTVLKMKGKKISMNNYSIYEKRAEDLKFTEIMNVFNQFYNF